MAANFLRTASSYILKTGFGGLLQKGIGYLKNKVVDFMDSANQKLLNNKYIGPIYSKWGGYDDFKNKMLEHGQLLEDRLIKKVIPVDEKLNAGKAFINGIKEGLQGSLFGKKNADSGGTGDVQKPVDNQAENQVAAVVQDPANVAFGNAQNPGGGL